MLVTSLTSHLACCCWDHICPERPSSSLRWPVRSEVSYLYATRAFVGTNTAPWITPDDWMFTGWLDGLLQSHHDTNVRLITAKDRLSGHYQCDTEHTKVKTQWLAERIFSNTFSSKKTKSNFTEVYSQKHYWHVLHGCNIELIIFKLISRIDWWLSTILQ